MKKNRKKRDEIVFSSRASCVNKIVSLIRDGASGSYAVMITNCGKEPWRAVVVAFGIVDFDDARLVFDRQSKIIFDEVRNIETKGM